MKKHESSEGLVNVEAGLNGIKKTGKKSSCSAGLLLAIIIAILLLLSLVISSLFWAVYTKLTNEQLRIFDATSVSDLEPLESNDVFVDSLMLQLAATQQNETDRVILKDLATRRDNENETETEVRVEPIPSVGEDFPAPRLDLTTETAETSPKFAEESPDDDSFENSISTTSIYDDAEWSEKSSESTTNPSLEIFDDIIDDTAALKVVPWFAEPIDEESQSFEDQSSETISLNWLPVTSVLNLFNGNTETDDKYYLTFSSEGKNVYVETNTDLFTADENSTVSLNVVFDDQDSMSSEMRFENLWDWLGSYASRSSELTIPRNTDDEDNEEYSYDDLDYLDYYENSESYEDTEDESRVVESSRWNDLVDALSMLRIEFSSNHEDNVFSTENPARSIPTVFHDLKNYTHTLARGMSDVFASLWNDSPTNLENDEIEVASKDSSEANVPKMITSTEISPSTRPNDVENENTATNVISGTSEAPISFDDDSYDYYWFPDEERLENLNDDLVPTNDSPFIMEPSSSEWSASSSNNGLKPETTESTKTDAIPEEYEDYDSTISGSEDAEISQFYESEKPNEDLSSETEPTIFNEELEKSEIERKAVQKLADILGFRDAPQNSNEEPRLIWESDDTIETVDDDDARSMKMLNEIFTTMSEPKYNLDEEWLDEIAAWRDYLNPESGRDSSRSEESSSSIVPTVFTETTENSDDDSQNGEKIYSIAKRDVIRRRSDLPPRLLRKKTPSEIFARARRVRQVDEDIATSSFEMQRDLLKETADFDSKMDRVANHIDRLQDRFLRRNKLDDDYVSKEMPDDEEDPRNL